MKIDFALFSVAAASHFRAIGFEYEFIEGKSASPANPIEIPDKLRITRSIGWRWRADGWDGYGGCSQEDIDNQIESPYTVRGGNPEIWETISGIATVPAFYTVSLREVSPQIDPGSWWCFGKKTFEVDVPSGVESFLHTGSGCCTIPFTLDDGQIIYQGNYGYKSTVDNLRNSSPHFQTRPIWVVVKGCQEQYFSYFGNGPGEVIDYARVDPEGDVIKCKWANSDEAYTFGHRSGMEAFELDEDTCVVTYRPENDTGPPANKPIAIMIEDYDRDTMKRNHAVPSIFIAITFEADLGRVKGDLPSDKKLYAGIMPADDHDDDHHRRRREAFTEPAYCDGMPILDVKKGVTETDNLFFVWNGSYGPSISRGRKRRETETTNVITVPWSASYKVGEETFYDFPRFHFSNPQGMTCSDFNDDGDAFCTWEPTAEQALKGHHSHCAEIYDPYGRPSNRVCVNIIFNLEDCPAGFRHFVDGEVIDCEDVDECRNPTTCGANQSCKNTAGGFECSCQPGYIENDDGECVFADDAELTLQQWIDMTSDVLVGHGRAGKFATRVAKLARNAFDSIEDDCQTPFNAEKYGGSNFFDWSAAHSRSNLYCAQTTQVKEGFQAFIDNYSCADGKNARQVHRVTKFLEKLTNPYC